MQLCTLKEGGKETWLGPSLTTKGLEKCLWQAHVGLMEVTPGLAGHRQADPEFKIRVRGLPAQGWRPEFVSPASV